VKGSVQVARKILPRIWRSSMSLMGKIECSVHLTQNLAYIFVLLLSICIYPAVLVRFASGWFTTWPVELLLFLLATVSVFFFYGAAVAGVRRDWKRQLGYMPAVMSVAIGLSVSNTRAIVEGLIGKQTPFYRTPKFAIDGTRGSWRNKSYRGLQSGTALFELVLAAYFVGILVFTLRHGLFGAAPFVLLFLFGYLYVGLLSLDVSLPRWKPAAPGPIPGADA
jgi:hypothetical protein